MTTSFATRTAARFIKVWGGELGVVRCRVVGVRGDELIVKRADPQYTRWMAQLPELRVKAIAPKVYVFA